MISVTKADLERMYLTEHKTLAEIGAVLGCTRQNVHYLMRKFSIKVKSVTRFVIRCDGCGSKFSITRKRFVLAKKHFHSKACYTGYMHTEEYREWRKRFVDGK